VEGMLVGIGVATLTPAALSLLSQVFPSRQLVFAAGCYAWAFHWERAQA